MAMSIITASLPWKLSCSIYYILYTVHDIRYTIYDILYTVYCMLYTIYYILHHLPLHVVKPHLTIRRHGCARATQERRLSANVVTSRGLSSNGYKHAHTCMYVHLEHVSKLPAGLSKVTKVTTGIHRKLKMHTSFKRLRD